MPTYHIHCHHSPRCRHFQHGTIGFPDSATCISGSGKSREFRIRRNPIGEFRWPARRWDWEHRIGRRVRLRDLHILSAVVRWGSMAKAASHLAMSQSAVSEAIAGLEDALRVRLLDRSPQGITNDLRQRIAQTRTRGLRRAETRDQRHRVPCGADQRRSADRLPGVTVSGIVAGHHRPAVTSLSQNCRTRGSNGHDDIGVSGTAGSQGRPDPRDVARPSRTTTSISKCCWTIRTSWSRARTALGHAVAK